MQAAGSGSRGRELAVYMGRRPTRTPFRVGVMPSRSVLEPFSGVKTVRGAPDSPRQGVSPRSSRGFDARWLEFLVRSHRTGLRTTKRTTYTQVYFFAMERIYPGICYLLDARTLPTISATVSANFCASSGKMRMVLRSRSPPSPFRRLSVMLKKALPSLVLRRSKK